MKKRSNVTFAVLFCMFLFIMPIATLLAPHSDTSFYEQRKLATVPSINLHTIWDGTFFSQIEDALSDHIAFRSYFLRNTTNIDFLLNKPVVNQIIVTSDVLLDFHDYIYWDLSSLTEEADAISNDFLTLNQQVNSYGGYFCFLGLPLQSTYYSDHYPSYTDNRLWHTDGIREEFFQSFDNKNIPYIDMHSVYESMGYPEEYYLKTDYHFTLEGAFIGYDEVMKAIQKNTGFRVQKLERDDFTWTTLPNPFLGSENRKLFNLWKNNEKLVLAQPKNPIPFNRMDNGTQVNPSVFTLPEEDANVTYSLYMGGDIGETMIQTNRLDFPNLLIFGDSFTNPIESLIWTGFNETRSLDLRYYTKETLSEYIKKYQPDVVICVRDESVFLSTQGNGNLD